jgi:hypothetical protein
MSLAGASRTCDSTQRCAAVAPIGGVPGDVGCCDTVGTDKECTWYGTCYDYSDFYSASKCDHACQQDKNNVLWYVIYFIPRFERGKLMPQQAHRLAARIATAIPSLDFPASSINAIPPVARIRFSRLMSVNKVFTLSLRSTTLDLAPPASLRYPYLLPRQTHLQALHPVNSRLLRRLLQVRLRPGALILLWAQSLVV